MKVIGVIQAGGRSVRMGGRPKALIELGGRPIIERVVAALSPAVEDMLIVTNTPGLYAFLGLAMVEDVYPDHGSLGGIYSGLKAAAGGAALTVACDMPFLHPGVVQLVADRAGEGDAGRLKIVEFFERVRIVEIIEEDVARFRDPHVAFMNVNTPEELERARALAAELG